MTYASRLKNVEKEQKGEIRKRRRKAIAKSRN